MRVSLLNLSLFDQDHFVPDIYVSISLLVSILYLLITIFGII
jgi:hypothetical protein